MAVSGLMGYIFGRQDGVKEERKRMVEHSIWRERAQETTK